MAIEQNITAADHWFVGEDKKLRFTIFGEDGVTPLDVAAFAFRFVLSEDVADEVPKLEKLSPVDIVVGGIYDEDPNANEQYVEVAIAAANTRLLDPATYKMALKRTDDGSETILMFGTAVLGKAAAH